MENELIKIITNEEGKRLVSARELHEFLEISSNFSTWFKRMCDYGFEKDIDFTELWSDSKNGNAVKYLGSPQKMSANGYELDYIITIEMAKELSMIQRTDKGRQARRYFIECENKLKEISPKVLLLEKIYNGGQEGIIASKKLTELEIKEAVKPLEEKIEKDKPLVELAKKRLDKNGLISITDATKTFDLKRGQITSWAKEQGYIHKTQKEVNQKGEEYFKVYDNGGYKNIGITEEGINLINNNLEDIIK